MGKPSTLSPEKRTELVLRLLSKQEPASQIARLQVFRSRRCIGGARSFSTAASRRWRDVARTGSRPR